MRSVLPFLLTLVSLFYTSSSTANDAVSSITTSTMRPSQILDGHHWVESGRTYELYGVGGCGRATQLTAEGGRIADCGVLTTARLAAFFSTAGVTCRAVDVEVDTVPVVCVLEMGSDKIDLGMALIAGGYGFAALGEDGRPVVKNYLVAELSAKLDRQGLWATQGFDQQKLRQNNGKIDNAEK